MESGAPVLTLGARAGAKPVKVGRPPQARGVCRRRHGRATQSRARTVGQQRPSLARIAQAASQIATNNERFDPDEP
jgi:hypothetical protein